MKKKRLYKILYNAIIAFENKLDLVHDELSDKSKHSILLGTLELEEDEYQKIMKKRKELHYEEYKRKAAELLNGQ